MKMHNPIFRKIEHAGRETDSEIDSSGESVDGHATSAASIDWKRLTVELMNGEPRALEEIITVCWEPLTFMAKSYLGSIDSAEDVVQNALVRLWEGREELSPELSVRALLYKIVRNLCLNEIKHTRMRERHHEVGDYPEGRNLEETVLTSASYEAAMAKLSLRFQVVIRMRFEEGLSYIEIGEAIGITANAATQLVLRAKESLKREL